MEAAVSWITLLLAYRFKHTIADFWLQLPFKYMYGKFKPGWDYIPPLALHCFIHAVMSFGITYTYLILNPNVIPFNLSLFLPIPYEWHGSVIAYANCMMVFDFVVHFIMDRIKASPKLLGKYGTLTKNDWIHISDILADPRKKNTNEEKQAKKRLRENFIFWNALDLDQSVHSITHYVIIFCLLAG